MRVAFTAVLGAVTSAAIVPVAMATSLAGSPLVLQEGLNSTHDSAIAHNNGAGKFVLLYSDKEAGKDWPRRVSVRFFDAEGRPEGRKREVVDVSDKPEDFYVWGTGWLPLQDGTAMVALLTGRYPGTDAKDGALSGQLFGKKRIVGNPVPLDKNTTTEVISGGIGRLNDGRGFAVWYSSFFGEKQGKARFITQEGKPYKKFFDVTENGFTPDQIYPYENGIIARYLKFHEDGSYSNVGQIFDESGKKFGAPKVISNSIYDGTENPSLLGLTDSSILFTKRGEKSVKSPHTTTVLARIYNRNWKIQTKEVEILRGPYDHRVEALKDGNFLVASISNGDSGSDILQLTKFSSKLDRVGRPLRIVMKDGQFRQSLPLPNGKVLVTYGEGDRLMGQLVNP